jgi:hypothetical protein
MAGRWPVMKQEEPRSINLTSHLHYVRFSESKCTHSKLNIVRMVRIK